MPGKYEDDTGHLWMTGVALRFGYCQSVDGLSIRSLGNLADLARNQFVGMLNVHRPFQFYSRQPDGGILDCDLVV